MRDQRHPLYGVVLANTANRRLQLPRAFGGPAQRQMRLGRLTHLRIRIGFTKAVEIETPDVKACIT
jgi:hypothetical protein